MSSSIPLSEVPRFFYSIPYSNFEETNYKHSLDIDELLATPAEGLETARTLKKWRRLTQSARQRLLNARNAYAADASSKNTWEFSRLSIEVVSIPSSLYDCLAMAKATDETRKGKRAAKKAYKERCAAAIQKYNNAVADAEQEEQARRRLDIDPILGDNDPYQIAVKAARDARNKELEAAEDAYFTAYIRAIVVSKTLGNE